MRAWPFFSAVNSLGIEIEATGQSDSGATSCSNINAQDGLVNWLTITVNDVTLYPIHNFSILGPPPPPFFSSFF